MNETRTYDVIVIGAGPVGENVAERARAAGLSTVIVGTRTPRRRVLVLGL